MRDRPLGARGVAPYGRAVVEPRPPGFGLPPAALPRVRQPPAGRAVAPARPRRQGALRRRGVLNRARPVGERRQRQRHTLAAGAVRLLVLLPRVLGLDRI